MEQEEVKKSAEQSKKKAQVFVPMLNLTKLTQQGYDPNNDYYISDRSAK